MRDKVLKKRALCLQQGSGHALYQFSVTGDELALIADVSRISRDDAGKLIGYQRPEVKQHVLDIVSYLESDQPIFPNSLILALSSRVKFVRSRGPNTDDGFAIAGTLHVPIGPGDKRPAWIVDGQQRALALSKSKRRDFAVPINAFVADEVSIQRDQFLRVNNTKPLPRGLITELLPEVSSPLPARLATRKLPAALCEQLNLDPTSPFRGLIRRNSASPGERKKAVITDTSIIKMLEESLNSPSGCLFPYRNIATGETDMDGLWSVIVVYWRAVQLTFPNAWGKHPTQSRLMHGAGIRAMGRLMDRIMANINPRRANAISLAQRELKKVAPICRWTKGTWTDLNDTRWNEIENTTRDIKHLSSVLIRSYSEAGSAAA